MLRPHKRVPGLPHKAKLKASTQSKQSNKAHGGEDNRHMRGLQMSLRQE